MFDAARDMLWRWDPAGFASAPGGAPDRYDALAHLVATLLGVGLEPEDVAARLLTELSDNWGVVASADGLVASIRDVQAAAAGSR